MARLKKQDIAAQTGGVWARFDEIDFRIARLGNPRAVQLREAFAAENAAQREAGKPTRDPKEQWLDMLSQSILVDWRGLDGDNGEPLPYTPDEARKLLADPVYSDFKAWVELQSAERENFLEKGEQATEKNS